MENERKSYVTSEEQSIRSYAYSDDEGIFGKLESRLLDVHDYLGGAWGGLKKRTDQWEHHDKAVDLFTRILADEHNERFDGGYTPNDIDTNDLSEIDLGAYENDSQNPLFDGKRAFMQYMYDGDVNGWIVTAIFDEKDGRLVTYCVEQED